MTHHANRLSHSSSPYLLQHAGNPVDWYPWSDEALARARREDRPILLSIGYAACHWCHVMERESFENPSIAALMNESFVCIKVDREERPDLDAIYQTAVQVLGSQGGWPLTVFLTPALEPFFGGTYFPDTPRFGRPDFPRVLKGVAEAYVQRREQIASSVAELRSVMDELNAGELGAAGALPAAERLREANESLVSRWDDVHAGFGRRPKFPNTLALESWLRHGRKVGGEWHGRVRSAFLAMARGGLFDQLGGGFHRYSTDASWLVPHFEKMLYDNALLMRLGAQLVKLGAGAEVANAVRETGEWLLREMADEQCGFHSTQDADSEGEEGRFFVWSEEQIRAVVGEADAPVVLRLFGVGAGAQVEPGRNVLHRRRSPESLAEELGLPVDLVHAIVARARRSLFLARQKRVSPATDDKVIAAWNGLAVEGLVAAGVALNEPRFIEAARRCSDFVAAQMDGPSGLARTWRRGVRHGAAFAEDHAFLASGELALFAATSEARHLTRAQAHLDRLLAHFLDADGGLFVTSDEAEVTLMRPRASHDDAVPSATSAAVSGWLKLAALTGESRYQDAAERALARCGDAMAKNPFAYGWMLCGLDAAIAGVATLVVVGPKGDALADALHGAATAAFAPNLVVMRCDETTALPESLAALLAGKARTTSAAYLCRAGACERPLSDVAALLARLSAL
jgi:uncharacterized protein YyaL (SSP411 family)